MKTYENRGNDRNLDNHFEVCVSDLLITYCHGFSKFANLVDISSSLYFIQGN